VLEQQRDLTRGPGSSARATTAAVAGQQALPVGGSASPLRLIAFIGVVV
jgi:hypothetical protein